MDFTENEIEWVQKNYSKYGSIVIQGNTNHQGIKERYPIMTCLECKRMRAGVRNIRL